MLLKLAVSFSAGAPIMHQESLRSLHSDSSLDLLLSRLLVGGSDTRLAAHPVNRLNKYGCTPTPRPEELSYSSSTASTVSEGAYRRAELALSLFSLGSSRRNAEVYERLIEQVRSEISACFELPCDSEVILSPSGTDTELPALFVARGALKVTTISVIVGAEETGSGVGLAASGRHFDSITSAGRDVMQSEPIDQLVAPYCIPIHVRDYNGTARIPDDVDAHCVRLVASSVAAGFGVAFHVMDHSKLGSRYPSDECIEHLLHTYGQSVQIVVDACQGRLSRSRMKWYLDRGCIVLITGSKYFTGPPLSGALIVPAPVAARVRNIDRIPGGLADYSSSFDWPQGWRARSELPERMNMGLLLRWIAAAYEMQRYSTIPEFTRTLVLRELGPLITNSIELHPNFQSILPCRSFSEGEATQGEFSLPTIYPFLIQGPTGLCSFDESHLIYRALNIDLSAVVPQTSSADLLWIAALKCHVGQPVAIANGRGGFVGALRLSLDARMVSQCSQVFSLFESRQKISIEVNNILKKIELILQNFDAIQGALNISS